MSFSPARACCESWAFSVQATKVPNYDCFFSERLRCSVCRRVWKVTFQKVSFLGGDYVALCVKIEE
jgi:hypothetical protein